jgi:ATP-dependent Clp protease ATP-binding subunit ClpC
MVLELSREEAEHSGHGHIGVEHLLLGLLQEGMGVATLVLENLNVDLDILRENVEGSLPHINVKSNIPKEELRFTPRVKKVLALAGSEAEELEHNWVGTEHLLLGLLREGASSTAKILFAAGVTLESFRAEVVRLISSRK